MILYCDSSALVKLYVAEDRSESVRRAVRQAEAVATCRISWAELHAAMSRRARESPIDAPLLEAAKRALTRDWSSYMLMEVTQPLVERAAEFADVFALRAYDSVQLAAAAALGEAAADVRFACFDARLTRAARVLGMPIAPQA